jgi:hypothetical protein
MLQPCATLRAGIALRENLNFPVIHREDSIANEAANQTGTSFQCSNRNGNIQKKR